METVVADTCAANRRLPSSLDLVDGVVVKCEDEPLRLPMVFEPGKDALSEWNLPRVSGGGFGLGYKEQVTIPINVLPSLVE